MDKEALAKQSPLSLLGLPDTGPDLLDEVMKGRVQTPGTPFAKGFGAAKQTAFETFAKAAPIGLPESAQDNAGSEDVSPPATQEQKEEDKEQGDDLKEDTQPSDESTPDELPSYFHALNEQHEDIRQRLTANEQALKDSQRREQMLQEYLRGTQQRAQEVHQKQEPDYSWAEQGFESPEQYNSWRTAIKKEAREEALQIFQQQNMPMIQQMATDRFNASVSRCSKEYEHFDKYFPRESLNSYFAHIAQRFGPQAAATMDFEQEFIAAYKVRDYERLQAQLTNNEQKNKANGQTEKDAKQERKAQLKLVPKASQTGAPTTKKTLEDELAEMGKVTIRDVGRSLRSRLFAQ